MSDDKQMAAALGRVSSGLYVVTVKREQIETGMLVSWVQQCSFEPPALTVAVKRGREVLDWLIPEAVFTVNILDRDQTDMIAHFGRAYKPGEPAFTGLAVSRPDGAPPVLDEALGYLVCRVICRHPAGDHDLVIAEVVSGKLLGDSQPMVHVRKTGAHY